MRVNAHTGLCTNALECLFVVPVVKYLPPPFITLFSPTASRNLKHVANSRSSPHRSSGPWSGALSQN